MILRGDRPMGIEYEFFGDALVEGFIPLRGVFQSNHPGIDDLCNRQPIMQDRHHQLPIIFEHWRLAGVKGMRFRPAEAKAK